MQNSNLSSQSKLPAAARAYKLNDGGRAAVGFKGKTSDCVVRAIAIATGLPYQKVYDDINSLAKKPVSRTGVPKSVYKSFLESVGWVWTPTMFFGQGCKVHLVADELPKGPVIVKLSKHLVAVIDGVVHDTYDCTRSGKRCVYGYFSKG